MTLSSRTLGVEIRKTVVPVQVTFRTCDRLSISVHPNLKVTAIAPIDQPWERVETRIRARKGWIDRQRETFAKYLPAPTARRYVSGETYHYLGRQYRLRVRSCDTDCVFIRGGMIWVECQDRESAGELVRCWYRTRARSVLAERFQACISRVQSAGMVPKGLMLRDMKRRWGSCTKAGRILLNPDLIRTPSRCIDYVIIHELCHLKIMRHDEKFFRLLARFLPDWQERKARLDRQPLAIR